MRLPLITAVWGRKHGQWWTDSFGRGKSIAAMGKYLSEGTPLLSDWVRSSLRRPGDFNKDGVHRSERFGGPW